MPDNGAGSSWPTSSESPQVPLGGRGAPAPGKKVLLIFIAFVAGAAVMIIELAAHRILAPWFGNSLFTWTALIGVILLALSLGYYAGGWLADLRCDYHTLSHLLAVSAGAVFLIPLGHRLVGKSLQAADTMLGPVLASTLLFAVPGCLLGSLSPYIIRLVSLLSGDRHIGLSAGTIFMFSTWGSVIGTFGAGFFLIPHLQLDQIFIMLGGLIMILAALGYLLLARAYTGRLSVTFTVVNLVLCLSAALLQPEKDATVIYDKNNFYHRIRVFQTDTNQGDQMLSLYLDTTFQGAQYVRSPEIPSRYQRYGALSRIFCPRLEQAAFLGGGALAMPEAMIRCHPHVKVDVVEIDPEVLEVGSRFFRSAEYPQLTMIAEDARRYLRLTDKRYDLIFGDVYHGVRHIPPHLVTKEFFSLVKDRLRDQGVFMLNLIGTIQGNNSVLFKSTLNTIASVFKQTYVFAIDPDKLQQVQNIIIVARNHDPPLSIPDIQLSDSDPLTRPLLSHYIRQEKYDLAGAYLITDDHNPLEYLTAKSLYFTDN